MRLSDTSIKFYQKNRELYQIMFGVVGIAGVHETCGQNSAPNLTAEFVKSVLAKALSGSTESLFINWWALMHGFISIGMNISSSGFKELIPFYNEAIERFLKN